MKEKLNEPIYTLTGTVIHGRGIGKHVGTPTANMEIAKNTFLPKTGVYVADILLSDKIYYGVTHIGTDRKSTRLNSSHWNKSRMPSSA